MVRIMDVFDKLMFGYDELLKMCTSFIKYPSMFTSEEVVNDFCLNRLSRILKRFENDPTFNNKQSRVNYLITSLRKHYNSMIKKEVTKSKVLEELSKEKAVFKTNPSKRQTSVEDPDYTKYPDDPNNENNYDPYETSTLPVTYYYKQEINEVFENFSQKVKRWLLYNSDKELKQKIYGNTTNETVRKEWQRAREEMNRFLEDNKDIRHLVVVFIKSSQFQEQRKKWLEDGVCLINTG